MKKTLIRLSVLLIFVFLIASTISGYAQAPTVIDIGFYRDGAGIYAGVLLDDTGSDSVNLFNALYESELLLDVGVANGNNSYLRSTSVAVPSEGEALKAFAFDDKLSPLSQAIVPASQDFTVTAIVFGKTYLGSVNPENHTITFDVPKSNSADNGFGDTLSDVSTGAYHTDGTYTLSFTNATASISEDKPLPLSEDTVVTVTSGHLSVDYTVEVHISEISVQNSFSGTSQIIQSSAYWGEDERKLMPDSVGVVGESTMLGVGQFIKSGETYDFDRAVGSFSLVKDTSSLRMTKEKSGAFAAYAVGSNYDPTAPEKLVSACKIKLLSAVEGQDLFSLYSSDLIPVIATTVGMEEGAFTIGIDTGTGGTLIPMNAPILPLQEWHDFRMIYRKDITRFENGGVYELYIDNRFVCAVNSKNSITGALRGNKEYPQLAIVGFDDATYSLELDDIAVTVVRPRADILVEKLPEGKTSAYTLTADDGHIPSAKWYNTVLEELGLKGSLALNSDSISNTNQSILQTILAQGKLDAGNHAATHKTLTEVDSETLEYEVNSGQKKLREMFPTQRVLTMYLPSNQRNDTAMSKIRENHYAVRYSGTGAANSLYMTADDLYYTTFSSVLSSSTPAAVMNAWTDDAIAKGRWAIEMWHQVEGDDVDGNPTLSAPYVYDSTQARAHLEYISAHKDEMYFGTYDELVCYILERNSLRLQETATDDASRTYSISYNTAILKNASDAQYFDVPVTMNVIVPNDWTKVLVYQNNQYALADVYTVQSAVIGSQKRKYVLFDAVPNAGDVTITSVAEDYVIPSGNNTITSASVTVGAYTYEGLINPASKEITFSIPYAAIHSELGAPALGNASPAIIPDMSETVFHFETDGHAYNGSTELFSGDRIDPDEIRTVTVVADNGNSVDYTLRFDYMTLISRYNANGATLTSTTETQASRRGVPVTLTDGNVYAGNYGSGVWRVEQNGMAYHEDGSINAESTFAALSIGTNPSDPSDNYIKLNKYAVSDSSHPVRLYQQTSYGNDSDVIRTSFRFNLKSFTSNNSGLIYLWSGDADQLLLSCMNTEAGKFTLTHRANSNANMQNFPDSPVLSIDTWYTLTTVFRKDDSYEKEYGIEVYLQEDGNARQYLGTIADQDSVPTGRMTWQAGYNDFTLTAWSNAIFDLNIDDVEILSVDNPGVDRTVYFLGDSICRYYGENAAPQQGWGKYFSDVFEDSIRVLNYSVGGYNTNIYLNGATRTNLQSAPIWPSIRKLVKPGDFVVIALGWNESNTIDGSTTTANFKANLKTLADQITQEGAVPIFVTATPNLNASYDAVANSMLNGVSSTRSDGTASGTVYPARDMREFSQENGYVCLDLNEAMYSHLMAMGIDTVKEYFTGSCTAQPNNALNKDSLHLTESGAALANDLLIELLKNSDCDLKYYLSEVSENTLWQNFETATKQGLLNSGWSAARDWWSIAEESGNHYLLLDDIDTINRELLRWKFEPRSGKVAVQFRMKFMRTSPYASPTADASYVGVNILTENQTDTLISTQVVDWGGADLRALNSNDVYTSIGGITLNTWMTVKIELDFTESVPSINYYLNGNPCNSVKNVYTGKIAAGIGGIEVFTSPGRIAKIAVDDICITTENGQ